MIPMEAVDVKIQELLAELLAKCDCKTNAELVLAIGRLIASVSIRLNSAYGKDTALTVLNVAANLIVEINNKKVVVQ